MFAFGVSRWRAREVRKKQSTRGPRQIVERGWRQIRCGASLNYELKMQLHEQDLPDSWFGLRDLRRRHCKSGDSIAIQYG
jgi:hypothetical protein